MGTARGMRDGPLVWRRERLVPLIWRRLSLLQYRASERFGRHRRIVGAERALPVADFVDALTAYFVDRLPARTVARIGVDGCRRRARVVAALLRGLHAALKPAWWFGRFVYRLLRGHCWRMPAGATFHRRTPAGNIQVTLGGRVRLWGFACDGRRLVTYWQRMGTIPHPVQIFVHLYPPGTSPTAEDAASRRLYKDHDPAVAIAGWPRGRVFEDVVELRDVAPGDYRIDIGIIDLVRRERFEVIDTGETAVSLGWIRVPERGEQTGSAATPQEVVVAAH